jgi:aryl-alcohol dehydrogenase
LRESTEAHRQDFLEFTAAVARTPRGPFTIENLRLRPPQKGEVLVKVSGVGVCHTDLAFRDQIIPYSLPAVLGHEGSGTVVDVGEDVSDFAVGDPVVVSFSSCGQCDRCQTKQTSYCRSFSRLNYTGRSEDGVSTAISSSSEQISSHFFGQSSFASYVIASNRNLVKVDESNLPLEMLGPLACGIQTGAGSVLNSLNCQSGSSIAILGGGTVGLSAVMAAVIAGCSVITVIEPFEKRRLLAIELGATNVLDPEVGNTAVQLRSILSCGYDYVLDTTGDISLIESAVSALGSRGTLGLVGLPAQRSNTFRVNLASLVGTGTRIVGIVEGDSDPKTFIPQMLSYHKDGRFPFEKLITFFSLGEINRAVALQSAGEVVKIVLLP